MQYHYVIYYDDQTQEFSMDYDTQEAKFNNSPIYDTDSDTWIELDHEHWSDDNTTYNRASDALWGAIQNLQLRPEDK